MEKQSLKLKSNVIPEKPVKRDNLEITIKTENETQERQKIKRFPESITTETISRAKKIGLDLKLYKIIFLKRKKALSI